MDEHVQSDLDGELHEGSGKYNTPLEWVRPISQAVGGFDCDPCASADSQLAAHNIRKTGGLKADWEQWDTLYVNHPYADPGPWLRKALESDCETIVTLSKCDLSTVWFWEYSRKADVLCAVNTVPGRETPPRTPGRIPFVGEDAGTKFANLFGVYGTVPRKLIEHFKTIGWVFDPREGEVR